MTNPNFGENVPDIQGHFGRFGGKFVAETLMGALEALEIDYQKARFDQQFQADLQSELSDYVGRPSPLYHAKRWSEHFGGPQIYLKREDLNHTGSHKINNVIGQILLAKRSGKTRIIAETGAGQHGVATASAAAKYGLDCVVYMGAEDVQRQSLNVFRMQMLGAKVIAVEAGSKTLKDALNEALRDWVSNVDSTFYVIGTVAGPHPYPMLVRDFQRIIGDETKRQILEKTNRLPTALLACVGGGSNAIGLFYPFLQDEAVRLIGVEAGGDGVSTGRHSAPLTAGRPGILHGNRTYIMEDENGQILPTHSVSAGLDYSGVGPEHAYLKDIGRAEYVAVNDIEAMTAVRDLNRLEGILPAIESAHAMAYAKTLATELGPEAIVVINMSGRGDKDINTLVAYEGLSLTE